MMHDSIYASFMLCLFNPRTMFYFGPIILFVCVPGAQFGLIFLPNIDPTVVRGYDTALVALITLIVSLT